jgi:hypothetical protein
MIYRRKPITVDAFKLGRDVEPDWWKHLIESGKAEFFPPSNTWVVTMDDGVVYAKAEQWIVRFSNYIQVCDDNDFRHEYEEVYVSNVEWTDTDADEHPELNTGWETISITMPDDLRQAGEGHTVLIGYVTIGGIEHTVMEVLGGVQNGGICITPSHVDAQVVFDEFIRELRQ